MTQPDTQGDVYGLRHDYINSGDTLTGDTTPDFTQTQDAANGTAFDPAPYLDAPQRHNMGPGDDYLNRNSHLYRTNKPLGQYAVAVARPVGGVSGVLLTAAGLLAGWNLVETAGATAKLRIRSGLDVNQPVILTVTLAPNESTRDFPPLPIEYKAGLYLELVSGAIEGAIFTQETRRV